MWNGMACVRLAARPLASVALTQADTPKPTTEQLYRQMPQGNAKSMAPRGGVLTLAREMARPRNGPRKLRLPVRARSESPGCEEATYTPPAGKRPACVSPIGAQA